MTELANLPLDEDVYRKITMISYTEHIPVAKLVNDMLREHVNVYQLWRSIGFVLVSKDVLKTALLHTPEEEILESAENIAYRYREAAMILHGKRSLEVYIELVKSFVTVNGYSVERSMNGENHVLIVQFNMNEKYSAFLGNAYKSLIGEFANVERFEITKNLVFIEYKPK